MAGLDQADTELLIREARAGNAGASAALLERHRNRLRRMVAIRIDRRLSRRIDPSDIVQETLAIASVQLPQYLQQPPLPFYPWLRTIAWSRLVDLHRRHIKSRRRTVRREVNEIWSVNPSSVQLLAGRIADMTSAPGARLLREELQQRVNAALLQLPEKLREVLVLRHLEELSTSDVAAICGISEGTVKSRQFRALTRLRELMDDSGSER